MGQHRASNIGEKTDLFYTPNIGMWATISSTNCTEHVLQ